jgi:hypothetical protein
LDIAAQKKLAALSHRIMEHSSLRLWTISEERQEFDRYKTLVDASLQTQRDVGYAESSPADGSQGIHRQG